MASLTLRVSLTLAAHRDRVLSSLPVVPSHLSTLLSVTTPDHYTYHGMKVAQASVCGVLPESVLEVARCRKNHNHTVRVIAIHI